MGWLESRIQVAEQRIEMLYRRLVGDEAVLDGVRQQLRGAYQQLPGGGGDGSTGKYLACTLSANLAHGASLAGQTAWKLIGGTRANIDTNAKVWNDGPSSSSDLSTGDTVILMVNDDGSYTATGRYCP